MICKILDDQFDKLYLHQIAGHIGEIPLSYNNIANRTTWPYEFEGTHKLLGCKLFQRGNGINRITTCHEKVEPFFNILERLEEVLSAYFMCNQIGLNVQYQGFDGTTHTDSADPNDITLLMMTNPEWDSSWGGQFQLTDKDGEHVVEEHEYVPGRIIILPSKHPHRGLAPTVPHVYRTSIVWRVTPLDYYLRKNFPPRG